MEQGGQIRFLLCGSLYDDILVAGGIVHDERAGEPGKWAANSSRTLMSAALAPGTAIKQSTRRHSRNKTHFFIRAFLRIVFPRFYFSDSGPESIAAGLQFHYKRERRRKQYWRLADFQGGSPRPRRVLRIFAPAPSLRRSLYRRRFISSTPTSGGLPAEETRSAQTVMRMES